MPWFLDMLLCTYSIIDLIVWSPMKSWDWRGVGFLRIQAEGWCVLPLPAVSCPLNQYLWLHSTSITTSNQPTCTTPSQTERFILSIGRNPLSNGTYALHILDKFETQALLRWQGLIQDFMLDNQFVYCVPFRVMMFIFVTMHILM